ncbi:helix-turn-helix transcriptional regulator [Vibrio parahaemolyticus]
MFSHNLKEFRELRGLSQSTLAEAMGVTKQTILKWENNRTYPNIFQLMWLADFFVCTPNDLLLSPKPFKEVSFVTFSKRLLGVESSAFRLAAWEHIKDYESFFDTISELQDSKTSNV